MEVYILDSLLRRVKVVDKFKSMLWTERFKGVGDFTLDCSSTQANRGLFKAGTNLAQNSSYRVMQVETVEDKVSADGEKLLQVTGRSLEKILDDRVARPNTNNTTTTPNWVFTGMTAKAIATQMFHDICVTGVVNTADIIEFIHEGTLFPADTIAAPTDSINWSVEPKSLLQALQDICDLYDMGYRLIRNFDTSQLWFDIYMGSDRTTGQTTLPAVIFSPDLDNLQNTTELTTIALEKNVALVISPVGTQLVYPDGVDPASATGLNRRLLLVNATDLTNSGTFAADAAARGKEELSKNRAVSAFDGEIDQRSRYKYGTHYNLGDLVEIRNQDGATNKMQVIEQIFVDDEQGERSYPTLQLNQFITAGSWASWDFNKHWVDYDLDTTSVWSNQP
jgi:hypothetical protein